MAYISPCPHGSAAVWEPAVCICNLVDAPKLGWWQWFMDALLVAWHSFSRWVFCGLSLPCLQHGDHLPKLPRTVRELSGNFILYGVWSPCKLHRAPLIMHWGGRQVASGPSGPYPIIAVVPQALYKLGFSIDGGFAFKVLSLWRRFKLLMHFLYHLSSVLRQCRPDGYTVMCL